MAPVAAQRILITGARGRLATLIANHLQPLAQQLTRFSRTGGDGFQRLVNLTMPAHLAGAGTLLHLAWSTLPATSEKNAGSEWQHDLPALDQILQALVKLPAAGRPTLVFSPPEAPYTATRRVGPTWKGMHAGPSAGMAGRNMPPRI